jgi:carbon monoxide dehydrogenase subunit G
MVSIEFSLAVDRPPEEVFAFLTDLEQLPSWQSSVVEVRMASAEPLGVGSRFLDSREFLGRRVEVTLEVTDYDPPRSFAFRGEQPVSVQVRHELEPQNGGTKLSFAANADARAVFKLAERLVARAAERQIKADFANLKRILEARG